MQFSQRQMSHVRAILDALHKICLEALDPRESAQSDRAETPRRHRDEKGVAETRKAETFEAAMMPVKGKRGRKSAASQKPKTAAGVAHTVERRTKGASGGKRGPGTRRRGTDLDAFKDMIKTERSKGASVASLAEKHGVTPSYIYQLK